MSQIIQISLTRNMTDRELHIQGPKKKFHMIYQNQIEICDNNNICIANLYHGQVTGKAVTACLHLLNATPFHWHTKRQSAVETTTFGSEFVAVRIATDQIIDLRYTLMHLGVPVRSKI